MSVDSRLTGELVADLDLSGFSDPRSNGPVLFKRPLFVYGRASGSAFCFPYNSVTVRRILFKFGRFRQ